MSVAPKTDRIDLSDQEVRKLAYLARLDLTQQEVDEVRPQLGQILEFIKTLSELETEGVEPMTTALDVDNRWRSDLCEPSRSSEEALSNAPSRDDGRPRVTVGYLYRDFFVLADHQLGFIFAVVDDRVVETPEARAGVHRDVLDVVLLE